MTSTNVNLLAKFFAVGAGLALVLSSFALASSANAQTTPACYFPRNLGTGSTGADVQQLQRFLNQSADTRVAASGAGSPGMETTYYGGLTANAVSRFQVKYRSDILTPLGLTQPTGYFGNSSRAKANQLCAGTQPPSDDDDDDDTNDDDGDLSGGEASLESLEASDGPDDDVEEGDTAQVAEFEFDVDDGDIRIDRLDLTFDAGGSNDEMDPWDTFDTITLLDEDGDEIASEDVTDEDEWLENDEPYVFRFTGLDYVVREGDTGMITVEVEAQNGIDGTDDGESWTVYIDEDGLRGEDGEGIQQYLGDDTETVQFDVEEEGEGEELNISASADDPDSTTLQVEDDGRSDWYTVFAFELDAEDADVELDQIGVNLTTSDNNVSDVVNDAKLVIDGEEFDDFDWVSPTGSDAQTLFDIDGDFTVEEGETVTVEYMLEFKSTSGYAEGTTIQASTTGSLIEGEGADDLTADGSATGEEHTLRTTGIEVERTDRSAVTTTNDGADNDYATFEIEVDVTAFEDDVFISQTGTTAFTYQIENASTGAVLNTSTATTSVVSSSADTSGNAYRVNEGDTESFTFTVTLDPLAANEGASYRMQLLSIVFGDSAGTPTGSSWTATPASTYETQATFIND